MALEMAGKIPPHNLEAEQSLLGALLIDKDAIIKIADLVTPDDFYKDAHGKLFSAMIDLYEKHEPIDLLSLSNLLEERGVLDSIGGRSMIMGLAAIVPNAGNVIHYARIIQKKALLRRLNSAASEISELSYQGDEEVSTILDKAEQRIFAVSQKLLKKVFVPLKEILSDAFERIDEIHRDRGKMRGIPTGFTDLDGILAGLQKSDLVIIAARPSVGKTSLALDIARQAAIAAKNAVGIFSLEMSKEQLVDRLICSEAGVDLWKMRTGKLSDAPGSEDFLRIGHAINALSEAKLFIDDTASANILEIKTKARRLQSEHGLSMIILDYLQLMESPAKSEGRVQEIAEITRGLKAIARELNVPVVALSQLSRAVELNKPAIPKLAHLRESGCLAGDTMIMDAKTGRRYTMKELAQRPRQTPIHVYSLDNSWKMVVRKMTKVFPSGKKRVYELKMRSGRTIEASANHPFRMLESWKSLDQLSVGDRVAIPRHHTPTLSSCAALSQNELIFLAHMLGDGCMVDRQPVHYTSADRKNIETVCTSAKTLFSITPRVVQQKNWWHAYLPSPYHLTHNTHHPVRVWLRKHGSDFGHSWEKTIPEPVFLSPNDDICLFLRHLWATDGNISWKRLLGRVPSASIYYASTSKKLVMQVQHLLLRIGIMSTIRQTQKAEYRPCYQLHVQGKNYQRQFLSLVGSAGERGAIIPKLLSSLATIQANTNTDTIPATSWRSVVASAKDSQGLSWRDISHGLDMQYCGSTLFKHGISRDRMTRIAKVCDSTSLQQLASSDIFWDEITAITPRGIEEVYDATVEDTHNFLANDIFVHNSIEQDADVVMFIYRKAADRNYRIEELSEEEKNTAEIHVAKHRNGPTGLVRLFWDERRASFRNLDSKRDFSFFDESPTPPPPSVPF